MIELLIKVMKIHLCSRYDYFLKKYSDRFTPHDMNKSFNTVYGVMVMLHNAIKLLPNWKKYWGTKYLSF